MVNDRDEGDQNTRRITLVSKKINALMKLNSAERCQNK
jgi:hypothetical protein